MQPDFLNTPSLFHYVHKPLSTLPFHDFGSKGKIAPNFVARHRSFVVK
jgi:hypothetical protein